MRIKLLVRGIAAVAVVAAAVFAIGIGTQTASAQVPAISANGPYAATAGVAQKFTGTANIGPLSAAVWSFSDGTSVTGISVYKTFAAPGVYTATVSVTNTFGQSVSASTTVSVSGLSPVVYQTGVVAVGYPAPGAIVSPVYPTSLYAPTYSPVVWSGPSYCPFGTALINGILYCRYPRGAVRSARGWCDAEAGQQCPAFCSSCPPTIAALRQRPRCIGCLQSRR